ncbi:MAG TPA: hypothetical protein VHB48_00085 [Chitinophagaceae bacterium]|nr:hypothetical protein [Chitinophagaceae bacterium]
MQKAIIITCVLLVLPAAYIIAGPRGFSSDPGAPIDGGISLLIAAGAGYGIKKVRDARKNKQAETTKE